MVVNTMPCSELMVGAQWVPSAFDLKDLGKL
jgi:hypothetical protein